MEEIAQVYARALFDVAREQDKIDKSREPRGQLADTLQESHDLQVFLFSPYFSTKEKEEGLERAISGAHEALTTSSRLRSENHRMPVIFRVRRDYDALWEEENKLLPASVPSAIELDE